MSTLTELWWAMTDLDDTSGPHCAQLAIVLGKCRLQGTDLGEWDGTLTPPMTVVGLTHMLSLLAGWTAEVQNAKQYLDSTGLDPQVFWAEVILNRYEAWAAFVALDEGYEASDCSSSIQPLLEDYLDSIDSFDTVLHQAAPSLRYWLAHLPLQANLLTRLAGDYVHARPWFLTLED